DTYRVLPSGVGSHGCCWGTWQVLVLPFVEQESLFKLYVNFGGNDGTGPRYGSGPNLAVTRTRLAILTCPSDRPNAPRNGITNHNDVVNYGNTSLYALPLNGVPFLGAPFNCYNGIPTSSAGHDWDDDASATPGILGRPVPFAEIVDGLSNTLLVSETVQGQGSDLRGFTWWGSVSGFVT